MPHYFIVIVIYGKTLSASSTIASFAGFNDFLRGRCRIYVWDNSPVPSSNEEILEVRKGLDWSELTYHHNHGENVPLSSLYNRSIQLLQDDEMLVILDDDSRFDQQLFEVSDQMITQQPAHDLFLPIVRNGQDIVSPAAMVLFKGHYLKEVVPGPMSCRHRTAINSGMMIRASYMKHVFEGYDERIRFYFTDNDFMARYNDSHSEFYVLDYVVEHSLNFYAKGECFTTKSRRFRELRRSFLILMRRRSWFAWLATQIYMVVYSVKYAIIHRDIRYVFVF